MSCPVIFYKPNVLTSILANGIEFTIYSHNYVGEVQNPRNSIKHLSSRLWLITWNTCDHQLVLFFLIMEWYEYEVNKWMNNQIIWKGSEDWDMKGVWNETQNFSLPPSQKKITRPWPSEILLWNLKSRDHGVNKPFR